MARPPPHKRRLALLGGGLLALSLVSLASPGYLRSAAFVARVAGLEEGVAGRLARWDHAPWQEEVREVPTRHGPLRARLYRPSTRGGPTLLLTPGVHADGVDEPRLVELARDFAAGGLTVLTLELPELVRYRITPRLPDLLEDAVLWAAARPELAPQGKVGLVGISFSGGLSLVAAGRPAVKDKVAFTLSLGGHGELPRVLRFLCTGLQPDGTRRTPHDYGLAVLLLNLADRLVPPAQVPPLTEAVLAFLRASNLTLHDARQAEEAFARARALQSGLPEPAASLAAAVNARDVERLGAALLPHVEAFAREDGLSPERSPPPASPVYLLHGEGDAVVPASEAELLARHLEGAGVEVRALRTPLIGHAELGGGLPPRDVLALVHFWVGPLAH